MHISNKIALDVSQIDKLLHIASQGCNGKTDGRDIFDNFSCWRNLQNRSMALLLILEI